MSGRKICVVSGSRADYGLLVWPMRLIQEDPELDLQVVVTGMHLAADHGFTYRLVEHDGFAIDAKVEMLLAGDNAVAVTKSIGLGVIGFADALHRLRPDILLVPGDRFEILAAVQAAMIARVPVAHLCGGDTTEGAFDESIRHAVTKMAHLHFVTNDVAARRVRQMGENPDHIHQVGSPGLDHLGHLKAMPREEFFETVGLEPRPRNLLVTFHPVTLDLESSAAQFEQLLGALDDLGPDHGAILTSPNADTEGRALGRLGEEFAAGHKNAVYRVSLGRDLYLNALGQVDAVVGNSSSGLYEAPSFKIPTVNIGDRQGGRLRAASVIDCAAKRKAIVKALEKALALDCSAVVNPYGDGKSAPRIVAALKAVAEPSALLKKHFFDLEAG